MKHHKFTLALPAIAFVLFGIATLPKTAQAATTLVQWGEAGGDTGIITTGNGDNTAINGTYTAGNTITDTPGSGYYDTNTGRSPTFNGAETNNGNLEVRNDSAGDYFQAPFNTGFTTNVHAAMFVWETANMLTSPSGLTLSNFTVEFRGRNSNDIGSVRFLVEEAGQFYISAPSTGTLTTSYQSYSSDPSLLTWNLYTPFSGGADTIGASATPTFASVDSVGLYASSSNSSIGFTSVQTRYFQVSAVPEPSSTALLGLGGVALMLRRKRN